MDTALPSGGKDCGFKSHHDQLFFLKQKKKKKNYGMDKLLPKIPSITPQLPLQLLPLPFVMDPTPSSTSSSLNSLPTSHSSRSPDEVVVTTLEPVGKTVVQKHWPLGVAVFMSHDGHRALLIEPQDNAVQSCSAVCVTNTQ